MVGSLLDDAQRLRDGRLDIPMLVEQALARIASEGRLHAMAWVDADAARQQAQRLQRGSRRGDCSASSTAASTADRCMA